MDRVRLGDILEYEQPSKYIVKSDQYKDDYKIPVLTAGKTFILGYTNESEGIYNASPENPIILFDDFTTECRYIDFDFKVKSSAVKILKPIGKVYLKYIYYVLKSIVYDTTSHKRYWISQYSNFLVTLPDAEFQKKVVEKLEKIENLISIKKKELLKLDKLTKSQFVEMFGNPVLNEKGWKKKKLSEECNIITGNTPSRNVKEYYGNYIEWIKSDNINTPSNYITKATEYLSESGMKVGRTIGSDSILMTCIAGSISCIGNVAMTDRKVAFNQQINGIETLNNNTWFMYFQFILSQQYIQSTINMCLKGILSKGNLSELEFIFPPIELQNQFAEVAKLIDKQKAICNKEIKRIDELIETQKLKYFGGVISE